MITALMALIAFHPSQQVTSIDALPDPPDVRHIMETRAYSGTSTGYAVGYVFCDSGGGPRTLAQVWTPEKKSITLSLPGGGRSALLSAVNGKGLAAGRFEGSKGTQILIWDAATGKVQTPALGESASAFGVNTAGAIVGSYIAKSQGHSIAIKYKDGALTELRPVAPWTNSIAVAINSKDQAVGNSYGSNRLATIWEADGAAKTIPLFQGTTSSDATGINDKGTVIGYCYTPNTSEGHAFTYGPEGLKEIPAIGTGGGPISINNRDEVVGNAVIPGKAFPTVGFLFADGKTTDLNDLLPANSGWVITEATFISDDGKVVGNGYFKGKARSFVLQLGK